MADVAKGKTTGDTTGEVDKAQDKGQVLDAIGLMSEKREAGSSSTTSVSVVSGDTTNQKENQIKLTDPVAGAKSLSDQVLAGLRAADNSGMKSAVLPLEPTPAQAAEYIKGMQDGLKRFLAEDPKSLKDIKIVVGNDPQLEAAMKESLQKATAESALARLKDAAAKAPTVNLEAATNLDAVGAGNQWRIDRLVKGLPEALKGGAEQTVNWLAEFSMEADWGRGRVKYDEQNIIKQLESAGFRSDEKIDRALVNRDANAFLRDMATEVLQALKGEGGKQLSREEMTPRAKDYKVIAAGGQIDEFTVPNRDIEKDPGAKPEKVKIWINGKQNDEIKGTLADYDLGGPRRASEIAAMAADRIGGAVKFYIGDSPVIAKPGQTGEEIAKAFTEDFRKRREDHELAKREEDAAKLAVTEQKFAGLKDLLESGKSLPFTADRETLAAAIVNAKEGKLSGYGAEQDKIMLVQAAEINTALQGIKDASSTGGPALTPELIERTMHSLAPNYSNVSWPSLVRVVAATAREDVGRAVYEANGGLSENFANSKRELKESWQKVVAESALGRLKESAAIAPIDKVNLEVPVKAPDPIETAKQVQKRIDEMLKGLPDAIKAGEARTVEWMGNFAVAAQYAQENGAKYDPKIIIRQLEAAGYKVDKREDQIWDKIIALDPREENLGKPNPTRDALEAELEKIKTDRQREPHALAVDMASDMLKALKGEGRLYPSMLSRAEDYKFMAETGGRVVVVSDYNLKSSIYSYKVRISGNPDGEIKGAIVPMYSGGLDMKNDDSFSPLKAANFAVDAAEKLGGAVSFTYDGNNMLAKPGQKAEEIVKPYLDQRERELEALRKSPEAIAVQKAFDDIIEAKERALSAKFDAVSDLMMSGSELPFSIQNREAFETLMGRARELGDHNRIFVVDTFQINTTLQRMADEAKSAKSTGIFSRWSQKPELDPELVVKTMSEIAPDHMNYTWPALVKMVVATAREDVGRAVLTANGLDQSQYPKIVEEFAKQMQALQAQVEPKSVAPERSASESKTRIAALYEETKSMSPDQLLARMTALKDSSNAEDRSTYAGIADELELVKKALAGNPEAGRGWGGGPEAGLKRLRSEVASAVGVYEGVMQRFDPLNYKAFAAGGHEKDWQKAAEGLTIDQLQLAITPLKDSPDTRDQKTYRYLSQELEKVKNFMSGKRPELAQEYAEMGGPEEVLAHLRGMIGIKAVNSPVTIDLAGAKGLTVLDPHSMSPSQMTDWLKKSGLETSDPAEYQRVSTQIANLEKEEAKPVAERNAREIEKTRFEINGNLSRLGMIMVVVTAATPTLAGVLKKEKPEE